jgi:hypothetical protein
MPLVFRIMKKDDDGFPTLSPTSLGVRPGDVDVDGANNIQVNGKGMSVSPRWRDININRVPKRLRPKLAGAAGSNNTFCYRTGAGPFQQGPFANGLTLEPDSASHGNIAPEAVVPFATYQSNLEATRQDWQEDEN